MEHVREELDRLILKADMATRRIAAARPQPCLVQQFISAGLQLDDEDERRSPASSVSTSKCSVVRQTRSLMVEIVLMEASAGFGAVAAVRLHTPGSGSMSGGCGT